MKELRTYADVALAAWNKYARLSKFRHYATILAMQAAEQLASVTNSAELDADVKKRLLPFLNREVEQVTGVFGPTVYRFGGNALAWPVRNGELPEALPVLSESAELLCRSQHRRADGLFDMPGGNFNDHSPGMIWIDTVFCVCPFLLWTGIAAGKPEYIDEAVAQMAGHHKQLFDPVHKLYFQAWNARKYHEVTPAHWSRGTGWGLIGLAELAADLPEPHPARPEILAMYQEVIAGCLAAQDEQGMWHQALEDHGSYPESSGTGLILYGLGRGIEKGFFRTPAHLDAFRRGIAALSTYVALDGSVFNCCVGCLAPGVNGTVSDYAQHPWRLNDEHAAGPVILAFTQAERLKRLGTL